MCARIKLTLPERPLGAIPGSGLGSRRSVCRQAEYAADTAEPVRIIIQVITVMDDEKIWRTEPESDPEAAEDDRLEQQADKLRETHAAEVRKHRKPSAAPTEGFEESVGEAAVQSVSDADVRLTVRRGEPGWCPKAHSS